MMGKGYPERNVVERSSLCAFSHPEPFSHVILREAKDPQIAAGEEPALSRNPEPQAKEQRRGSTNRPVDSSGPRGPQNDKVGVWIICYYCLRLILHKEAIVKLRRTVLPAQAQGNRSYFSGQKIGTVPVDTLRKGVLQRSHKNSQP